MGANPHEFDGRGRCVECRQLWPCQSILELADNLSMRTKELDEEAALANAIYIGLVNPDTMWWGDLPRGLQEAYRSAARSALRHLEREGKHR